MQWFQNGNNFCGAQRGPHVYGITGQTFEVTPHPLQLSPNLTCSAAVLTVTTVVFVTTLFCFHCYWVINNSKY